MSNINNVEALKSIKSNIRKFGFHTYSVGQSNIPRYCYTIGLLDSEVGAELIFAGGIFFDLKKIGIILRECKKYLSSENSSKNGSFSIANYGAFNLKTVDNTWVNLLCLGATDYHKVSEVNFLQIIPSSEFKTLEIPNLSLPYDPIREPIWKWLSTVWNYDIPKASTAVVNLACLKGHQVTEAMRWEQDEWELFYGAMPEVKKSDMRMIPMGTMLAIDSSLERITQVKIGTGLWRESYQDEWNEWKPKVQV